MHLVIDHLTFVERAQAGSLDRGDMDEYVSAAILRRNESIAFRRVEPFMVPAAIMASLSARDLTSEVSVALRRTGSCATNKAKLEYRDGTRFSQGVQQRDVIENKSPNPLDNRADRAHRHTIIGHNMKNTGAGG